MLDKVKKLLDTDKIQSIADMILDCDGKVYLLGNGASAAIASHTAVDLTKMCGIDARTFHDPVLMTCFTNDYGVENWMEQCVKHYCCDEDLAICISSSGESDNLINAICDKPSNVITLTGFEKDNWLSKLGDLNLWVDSMEYNVVESVHWCWLAATVELIRETK